MAPCNCACVVSVAMDRSAGVEKGLRATVEEGEVSRPRRSRRRRAGAALGAIAVATLGALWLERVPIATGFIDRELGRRNVAARYELTGLGVGRQRLNNVVIGDPRDPDLVADWVETRVGLGVSGPYLASVRAGHVRLRARLVDGKLSLGAIDRLLPASANGAKFTLPALNLDIADARLRLETPYGVVAAKVSGNGPLDNGFRGTIAALGEEISAGGCVAARPSAFLKIAMGREGPRLAGPVRIASARCGGIGARAARANLDVQLGPALDHWSGRAALAVATMGGGSARASSSGGTIDFAGNAHRTEGSADLASGVFALPGAVGEQLALRGRWRVADGQPTFAGTVRAHGVALAQGIRERIASAPAAATGTPLAPIARELARAAGGAARRFDVGAEVGSGAGNVLTVAGLTASAASGARLVFSGGAGISLGGAAGLRVDGVTKLSGGGFPAIRIAVAQRSANAPLTGTATVAPYAAGGARLRLSPIMFDQAGGRGTLRTQIALSGPLADGRVEKLRAPLVAMIGAGGVSLNPSCTPLAFDRLQMSGLVLRPARLTICPTGPGLFHAGGGRSGYGARVTAPRLAGTLGSSPLTLAADTLTARADGINAIGLKARLGPADRQTALDFSTIEGTFGAHGLAGDFAGGAGHVGNVPLLLSEAAGRWSFAKAALDVTGDLMVSDAAPEPRFRPLAARGVALRLADGAITTTGVLQEPKKAVKVADVTIRHVLGSGAGSARIVVPGLTFGKQFQPEELTRLTFGVIADVNGTVTGEGDIAWNADGITSSGTFRTAGTNLAAAFGPVTGLKGAIHFTDLLALESAPGQVATVASINPGVPVNDGRITYQTLPNTRIKIEGARWPFAGGELTLDPSLLDFSVPEAHRLTFRVKGAEAAQFLQQFDFKNLDATGTFDGELPIAFDQSGGRIESGKLAVRAGGGGIAYVGELTEKDLGTWGNIAFQALKSLRYRSLEIVMNGPLAGEMVTEVRFAGVSQGEGAKSNFLIRRLQKLPFVFNVRIKAPFRGLLDSVSSFYDPRRLIERNLPTLLEEQEKRARPPAPVQPSASEKMP